VELGNGVGLLQAQAIDNHEKEEVEKSAHEDIVGH